MGAYVLQASDFTTHTLSLATYLLWQRVLIFGLISGVIFCVGVVLIRYKQAENIYHGYQKETMLLRENEDQYHQLVELCPYAIALQSEDQIVLMNSAGLALLGAKKPEEIIQKSIWDFVSLEFREAVTRQYHTREGAFPPEVRLTRLDGVMLVAEMMAVPVSYKGRPALQIIFSDTTRRRQVEGELIKLRKAIDASGEVIFLTDREGVITFANPEFTALYGYETEEIVGKVTPRILKSGLMVDQEYAQHWDKLIGGQVVKRELVNKCKDGTFVTVDSTSNPMFDKSGDIIGFVAIQRDITQRKQAEKEIEQRSKELTILNTIAETVSRSLDLDRILNSAVDEVLKMDFLGDDATCMLFLVNEQTGELSLKINRGATENHPCLSNPPRIGECLCGRAVQESQVIVCANDRKDPRHSRQWEGMSIHQDICLPFKLGDKILGALNLRFPVTHAIAPSDYKLLKAVSDQIAIAVEKAQLFEAVSRQRHRLRYLAARLTEAEETERQRLARELHDQIGQNLLGLSINLSIIGSHIPNNGAAKQAQSCLQDSLLLVDQTTERIRAVMADLRPPVLDDYGLIAALRWYGDQVAKRTGISVEVRGNESGTNLSASTEMALFRVAQEALTNVSKHAEATQVVVILEGDNGVQRLVIADDGKGFDATHRTGPEEERGWGLLIMAERAEALGGRFWIESLPSKGTRVIVEVER